MPLAISVHCSNEISEYIQTSTTGITVLGELEGDGPVFLRLMDSE